MAVNGIFDLRKEGRNWNYYMFCSCGRERRVRKERIKTIPKCKYCHTGNTKHSGSKSRVYLTYNNIKSRCTNPKNKDYRHYGGRGIKVCDEWLNSFESFRDWSLKNGYENSLEIDRIDNDGNYEPSNCQWVTHKENSRRRGYVKLNLEKARIIRGLYLSSRHTYKSLSELFGFKKSTIGNVLTNKAWREE